MLGFKKIQFGFFHYCLSLIFSLAVFLAAMVFVHSQQLTNAAVGEVEHMSYNLLGFLEYDDSHFLVRKEDISEFRQFANRFLDESDLVYVWDLDKEEVVWSPSPESTVIDKQSIPVGLIERHAGVLANKTNSIAYFVPKANVVTIDEQADKINFVMTNQLFTFSSAENIKRQYLFVVARSLQIVDEDIAALTRVGLFLLFGFIVFLGIFKVFTLLIKRTACVAESRSAEVR